MIMFGRTIMITVYNQNNQTRSAISGVFGIFKHITYSQTNKTKNKPDSKDVRQCWLKQQKLKLSV